MPLPALHLRLVQAAVKWQTTPNCHCEGGQGPTWRPEREARGSALGVQSREGSSVFAGVSLLSDRILRDSHVASLLGMTNLRASRHRMRIADIASLHGGHYPTRPIDTTSGWFFCGQSDVESAHIYAMPVRVQPGTSPSCCRNSAAMPIRLRTTASIPTRPTATASYPTQEAFRRALEDLYRKEVLPARDNGLCAAIYTQLSDVEDEVNGLLTYDRALCKSRRGQHARDRGAAAVLTVGAGAGKLWGGSRQPRRVQRRRFVKAVGKRTSQLRPQRRSGNAR